MEVKPRDMDSDAILPAPRPYPDQDHGHEDCTYEPIRNHHNSKKMMSSSSETVGKTSSRTSNSTGSSFPQKPKRAPAGTNRENLALDQPLNRIQPVMQPVRTRRVVDAETERARVKRSFWMNTIFGMIMIGILVFGCIFGVIFSIVETRGALLAGGTPDYHSSIDAVGTSTPFVATTLVPSSFSTMVPSSYSTLVPTEITVYVQSEATTFINSDATTLVTSLVTLTRRDATASAETANVGPADLVKKVDDVTSTTGLTKSITTTITIAVYSTTYGHNKMQSELSGGVGSQQACGNGAQNACMSTANATLDTHSTFMTSTLSGASISPFDVNLTATTTAMLDGAATATANLSDAGVDKVTITYSVSMVCAMTDASSKLACSPVPTGWYVSPSPPRATSFLHPIFRFLSSSLSGIKDTGTYQSVRLGILALRNLSGKVFSNSGGGKIAARISGYIFARD